LREVRVTPPTMTFDEKLTLKRGDREIHLLYLGKANTNGDALVYLPKEKILMTGDILVLPTPYGFGSFPKEWADTLQKIAAIDFDMLIPGHGDIQTDLKYIKLLSETLSALSEQTDEIVAAGGDLAAVREQINIGKFRKRYTNGDPLLEVLFNNWFYQPITKSAYKQAKGEPIIQGE
ncbi:MAG: hypothetical protein MJA83_12660, partial [Gammaproteobacteria bacterium]|nr:hypothetical protein [Gammaproteobacteria bacterium]